MQSCLIADDHGLVREALAATVARQWPEAAVIEATDFPAAWALAAEARPTIALIDLDMPGATPLAGIDGLRAAAPGMPIVVVTGSCDDVTMLALLRGGVDGFADKSLSSGVIVAAIELVLAGGRYLPPRLADLHLGEMPSAAAAPLPRRPLSDRQVEIIRLIARGLSNKDIARELAVSPATIKTHVAQIIAATGANNRTDAVMRAQDRRLIELD